MQFDIKLKSQDMYRFNMYQTYTGFHGWFSIIVSIIIFDDIPDVIYAIRNVSPIVAAPPVL